MQFCVCCIGFQEALLRYVRLYTDGTDSLTITFHSYPTIIWFMFGVRFMVIALFWGAIQQTIMIWGGV